MHSAAVIYEDRLAAAEAHSLLISWDRKCERDKKRHLHYTDVENGTLASTAAYPSFYPNPITPNHTFNLLISICDRHQGECGPVCVGILCISSIMPKTLT